MEQYDSGTAGGSVTLPDILGVLWRRKWVFVIVVIAALAITHFLTKDRRLMWTSNATMILTSRGADSLTRENTVDGGQLTETPQTQISLIQSDDMADKTYNILKNKAVDNHLSLSDLGIAEGNERFRQQYNNQIKVFNPPDTNLVEITVDSDNNVVSSEWANALCVAFVDYKKELAKKTLKDIADNLQKKVFTAQQAMAIAEQAETRFKSRNGVVDLPTQQRSGLDAYAQSERNVDALKQELATAQSELAVKQAQLNSMRSNMGKTGPSVPAELERMIGEKRLLETDLADKKTKYLPGFPGRPIETLQERLADLDRRIESAQKNISHGTSSTLVEQTTLEIAVRDLSSKVNSTQASLNQALQTSTNLKDQLRGMPVAQLQYAVLARNAELARQVYSQLHEQLAKNLLSIETAAGNVQITQHAHPSVFTSSVARSRYFVAAAIAGVLLATFLALMLERSDTRIRSVERVRQLEPGNIVGALPRMSMLQIGKMARGQAPPQAVEAFSLACANLTIAHGSGSREDPWKQQALLITSAVPGEGKSVTAAQVARFMARSGRSTILMDADMRRPTQNRLFGLEADRGLADVLAGTMRPDDVLIDSGVPNLRLLPAGVIRANPTQMMSSPLLAEVIDRLRELADVVIVDAPACAVVADALLIAPHMDCILQVVSAGIVDEKTVRNTTEALRAAAPKTLAFFVNRASDARQRSFKSYYYQDYSAAEQSEFGQNGAGQKISVLPALPTAGDLSVHENRDRPAAG